MRLLPLHERRQAERKLARHLAGDDRLRIAPSLRIAPGHSGLHRSSRLSTTDINHRLLGKTTEWEPISYTLPHIPFGIKPDYSSIWSSTTTFMYNPVLSVVRIDAKHSWQPDRCQYHESILISVCRIHCFCNIPQTTEYPFYSVAYIPQEYLPFTFKPFHHGPYQDPQALYHQDSCAESY